MQSKKPGKREKLIYATIEQILKQGYSGTTVDDICAKAEVTKGSFFHYFGSKEEAGRAAMAAWSGAWENILADARFDLIEDPRQRLNHLIGVMANTYENQPVDTGCVVGTIAQEQSLTNQIMRGDCERHFELWIAGVTKILNDAKEAHPPKVNFDPEEVAWFLIGIVQGSMLVARTREDRAVILNNLRHAKTYLDMLFG